MERQIANEKIIIKAECMQELRSDRERQLEKKVREKLEGKLEREMSQDLRT